MNWRNNILSVLVLLLVGGGAFAQSLTGKAYECYNAQDYDCAQKLIDSAIVSDERTNSQTWQLRGVIYRKLESPENIDYRNIAIESFVQARNFDEENKYKEKIDELLYNTIIRYYNDAVTHLDDNNLSASEKSYKAYKEKSKKYVNPNQDFSKRDVEFYNALGSRYMGRLDLLEIGEKREKISDRAISSFQKVIEIDSSNWQANYNIGILHYNHGADLAMQADPFSFAGDIVELNKMLDRSAELFRNALPYLHRAKRIRPNHIGVLEGLTGSYYGLNDDANYEKYQTMLDKKQIDELLERHQKNPDDIKVVKELVRIYSNTLKDEEQYDKYKTIYDKLLKEQE